MINKQKAQTQRKLLKKQRKLWYKSFKIVVFAICFSAIGLCLFSIQMEKAFTVAQEKIEKNLVTTFSSIATIFENEKVNENIFISREKLHYKTPIKLGAKDLNLSKKSTLVKVQGQKKEISPNISIVRFIPSKS